ncbi:MAG TPA: hypothetical protein VLW75_07845 [Rhizomicrobium sp.]|nr:hypothetical protein [Rhizomicrobium sp.]
MFNRKILFGSVCALALGIAGPALADDMGTMGGMSNFSGTLSGDYTNTHFKSLGNVDAWGGNGEAMFGLGSTGVNLQADGGYHTGTVKFFGDSFDADTWNADGSLFTLINNAGRLGATYGYSELHISDWGTAHNQNYGLFGEWWAMHQLTVAGKAGGFDGNLLGSGYYAGAQGKFYAMDDLALSAAIDHTHYNSGGGFQETDYTLAGEYLFSEEFPISATGGWSYGDVAGEHADTWFIALKYYCNGNSGAMTLVDRQRSSGTLGYDVGPGALLARYSF